jgi:hypothetical protein
MNIEYRDEVERLFREAECQFGQICENPITGAKWVSGHDPVEPQKEAAYGHLPLATGLPGQDRRTRPRYHFRTGTPMI